MARQEEGFWAEVVRGIGLFPAQLALRSRRINRKIVWAYRENGIYTFFRWWSSGTWGRCGDGVPEAEGQLKEERSDLSLKLLKVSM